MFMSSVPTRLLYRNIIIENAILLLIILSNNVYATQGNAICLQISNYSLGLQIALICIDSILPSLKRFENNLASYFFCWNA